MLYFQNPDSYSRISLGGMCGAIVTSPFDVVKTRLQSSLFREKHVSVGMAGGGVAALPQRSGGLLWNFVETGHILRCVRSFPPFSSSRLIGAICTCTIQFFFF